MEADLQKRQKPARLLASFPPTRHGDQGAQPAEHRERLAPGGDRQASAEAIRDLRDRQGSPVEHPEQVDERGVLAQAVGQRDAPAFRLEAALDGHAEEQLVQRTNVVLRRLPPTVENVRKVGARHEVPADQRAAEEFVDALPGFADDGTPLERLIEDPGHVLPQLRLGALAPQGRRGAGANQTFARAEPSAQPPNEASQVRALRAV